jgi:2'-5' RNA ligase
MPKGTMIGYFLPNETARQIALSNGEAVDELHITILYLGKELTDVQKAVVRDVTKEVTRTLAPIEGTIGGNGRFPNSESTEGRDVLIRLVDIPRLEALRETLVAQLRRRDVPVELTHGYTPHITLAYVEPGYEKVDEHVASVPLLINELTVANDGSHTTFALSGDLVIKSVGGTVVEVDLVTTEYCWTLVKSLSGDTVSVTFNPQRRDVRLGDGLWWQGKYCYWTPYDGHVVDVPLPKLGYSETPRPVTRKNRFSDLACSLLEPILAGNQITVIGTISKKEEAKRLAFGWANVIEENGEIVIDLHGDIMREHELEAAVYRYVMNVGVGGLMHNRNGDEPRKIGRLVESMVFTKEKQALLSIDLKRVGWWIGFKVDDDLAWKRIASGELAAFSIHGMSRKLPVVIS